MQKAFNAAGDGGGSAIWPPMGASSGQLRMGGTPGFAPGVRFDDGALSQNPDAGDSASSEELTGAHLTRVAPQEARFIAIEGPIRVGKSTLAHVLAERLQANHIAEPENNPFLDRFYAAEPGTAFPTQMWFLRERFEQLQAATMLGGVSVSDYLFEKDKLFAYLNLTDAELVLYNRYYQSYQAQVARPDLVIYLQATPAVLEERLRRKGVAGEQQVSEEYMTQVVAAYEHYFQHYTASNLLVVDTSAIDFVENPRDLDLLLRRISEPVRGIEYFSPLGQIA